MNDLERASQVYQACLSVIPHSTFSFSKIWIYAAKLFVRRKDLKSARKLLGRAIGLCGKEKIFTEYVALELALGEVDRCRNLYTNYLKAMPHNCRAWSKYAELEKSVGESEVRDTLLNAYRLQMDKAFINSDVHCTCFVITISDAVRSTNWPWCNLLLTCLRCCGKDTLTLK
jgi:tetratricopeptide (TPR) repeat protein